MPFMILSSNIILPLVNLLAGSATDGDDMPGTISVLTKDGVGVNDHEESSSAGTTASGLATKKLRVLATSKVITKCVSGVSIFYLNNA